MPKTYFIDLLLPLPVPGTFTYAVIGEQAFPMKPGMRVSVQFGKKKTYIALVVNVHTNKPGEYPIKEILSVLDKQPVVNAIQLALWKWINEYYMCTPGEVYKAALPSKLRTEYKSHALVKASPSVSGISKLNTAQRKAFTEVKKAFDESAVVLLHGVTSSGKTEVYIHLINEAIESGKQVLYLLPEIALTTQIITRLTAVFGPRIAVYHSRFTDVQRGRIWHKLLNSNNEDGIKVVLGVRSALFLPFDNIGLVIIDEEHENTYKQFDPAPRYHARDTAIMLARLHGAKVLLGTATPSIETYYNCITGKYKLVELHERYQNLELPEITVVNTNALRRRKQMHSHFSPVLLENIEAALNKGEQVILFQNRRGFSLFLECDNCGEVPRCRHCDVSLTYHKKTNRLICHYCGFGMAIPSTCPSCGHSGLLMKGFGTEKIEEEIALFFPKARIERMDIDATRSRKSFEKLISRFEMRESDILVGTQMVSKGLDFDNVKLVGIMDADTMLNYPDFRAHERSFQLMAQVSGRAGRKNSRGSVIIQAYDHQHPVISKVVQNDYRGMFNDQLEERRKFRYPPFSRLINITLKHNDKELIDKAAVYLAALLRQTVSEKIMGPEYPLISRIRNLYLKSMLVKIEKTSVLTDVKIQILSCISEFLSNSEFRSVHCSIDVDPF